MLQGLITGFREGLEAFLVIIVMHRYLAGIGRDELRRSVGLGLAAGLIASLAIGFVLFIASRALASSVSTVARIWEIGAGFLVLPLITIFIVWMIRHGRDMTDTLRGDMHDRQSALQIFSLALLITAREGVEVVAFVFASPEGNSFAVGAGMGVAASALFALGLFFRLFRAPISSIFSITMAFLIVQAGFILGYSLHELLSHAKSAGLLAGDHVLLTRLFDASQFANGLLDHKTGWLGLILYAVLGWYSRPEWAQFLAQYAYTLALFMYWAARARKFPHHGYRKSSRAHSAR